MNDPLNYPPEYDEEYERDYLSAAAEKRRELARKIEFGMSYEEAGRQWDDFNYGVPIQFSEAWF